LSKFEFGIAANHTSDSMKKPTGTMSNPNHNTADSMKKPTGSAAMSNPNSTGDAMKKPKG